MGVKRLLFYWEGRKKSVMIEGILGFGIRVFIFYKLIRGFIDFFFYFGLERGFGFFLGYLKGRGKGFCLVNF